MKEKNLRRASTSTGSILTDVDERSVERAALIRKPRVLSRSQWQLTEPSGGEFESWVVNMRQAKPSVGIEGSPWSFGFGGKRNILVVKEFGGKRIKATCLFTKKRESSCFERKELTAVPALEFSFISQVKILGRFPHEDSELIFPVDKKKTKKSSNPVCKLTGN